MLNFYDVLPEEEQYFSKEQIKDIDEALKMYFPEKLIDTVENDLLSVIGQFLMNNNNIHFQTVSDFLYPLAESFYINDRLVREYEKDEIPELIYPFLERINGTINPGPMKLERTIMINGSEVHIEIDLDNGELAYRPDGGIWEVTEI